MTDKFFHYPAGQLGHLTETQQSALEEMKEICTERGLLTITETHPSVDDGTLMRFLRARKFDVDAAIEQFSNTVQWRGENGIDEVYESIDLEEYEDARQLYTEWTGRRDKRGFPFYVFAIGSLDTKHVAKYQASTSLKGIKRSFTTPVKMVRLFALYEHLTEFVTPWCTAAKDRPYAGEAPITQGCYIVDVEGMGLTQAWSLKKHLQDSSDLASKHYPETLGTIFIVGAPSFFPSIWGWIKNWLDPGIASKTFILSKSEVLSTISQYVDPEHIPKKYGGKLDWKFGDLPNIDPVLLSMLNVPKDFSLPAGPIRWQEKDGKMIAVALGKDNEVQRREEFASYQGVRSDMYYYS